MKANPYHSELACRLIESGTWLVDPERGVVISNRFGRPLGYTRRYVELLVWDGRTQKRYHLMAHRVIWEYVNGPIDDSTLQINHLDGVKFHNQIGNLELVDALGNSQHAYAHGLIPPQRVGQASPRAKLTWDQVAEIRALLDEGRLPQDRIAVRFGVSQATIGMIKRGERYRQTAAHR